VTFYSTFAYLIQVENSFDTGSAIRMFTRLTKKEILLFKTNLFTSLVTFFCVILFACIFSRFQIGFMRRVFKGKVLFKQGNEMNDGTVKWVFGRFLISFCDRLLHSRV
jgi:hypothetical protein